MPKLKPEFLKKNGRTEFVVLTAEDYRALCEMIEDAQDVLSLRQARAANRGAPGIPLEQMMRKLGMKPRRRAAAKRG
jgi:hypothetical protein